MELLKGRKKFILFFLLLFVFLFLGGVVVIEYIFMGLFILFMTELFLIKQKKKKERKVEEVLSRYKSKEDLNVDQSSNFNRAFEIWT